jgi:hypothetical protein
MELTFASLAAEVRRIVAADPEHVYRKPERDVTVRGIRATCFYSTKSAEGIIEACLFGRALSALGVTDAKLIGVETSPIRAAWEALGGERLSEPQRCWIASIQMSQDGGATWGSALADADARFGFGIQG